MSLSRRPAARFFAVFYRWNLHTRRPRACLSKSTNLRSGALPPTSGLHSQAVHTIPRAQQPDTDPSEGKARQTTAKPDSVHHQGQSRVSVEDPPHRLPEADVEAQELKESVRGLMRNVPSSVAVITVASLDPDTQEAVPMGVAVSSLSSVTLDPPTISFNIKHPSKTLDAIRAARGLFRVHYLKADRGAVNIVQLFCRGNHPDAYKLRLKDLTLHLPIHREVPNALYSCAPQILGDSVRAALECTVTHEMPVHDHVILVARVDRMEGKPAKGSTVMYVQGHYMKPDGTTLGDNSGPRLLAISDWIPPVWDLPLFPQEGDRREYAESIMRELKCRPDYLRRPAKDVAREFELNLPYPPSALGINMEQLILECKQESSNTDSFQNPNILCDFYGRLGPAARSMIIQRTKQLAKELPLSIELHPTIVLLNLGVSPNSRDLLPSDILNPLREEGLIEKFQTESRHQRSTSGMFSLRELEQIEHKLRKYLSTVPFKTALNTSLDVIMEEIGESQTASIFFKRSRSRLLVETHPKRYKGVDITGEVTQEEIRVILSRIVYFLHINTISVFRKHIAMDPHEVLRRVHVHPTITGMDVEFLLARVTHLYGSTRLFRDLAPAIGKMLEPWFIDTIHWSDLEQRVKEFVQKTPLRATNWSSWDQLAAMGIRWEATVVMPVTGTVQSLNQGNLLSTLLAKELHNHHGNGTEAEDQAIAKFLKNTYNFDVHDKSTEDTYQVSAASGSFHDEKQAAILAHLKVDVMGRSTDQTPLEPQITEQAFLRKQDIDASTKRPSRLTFAPQRELHHRRAEKTPLTSRQVTEPKQGKAGSMMSAWTSYSLNGDRKD